MQLPTRKDLMTSKEALRWLELDAPKIKGATQREVGNKLAEWKHEEMRTAYKRMLHKHHPDHNPGDVDSNQRVQMVRTAYEKLKGLKINLKKPVTSCPCCHIKCGRRFQHDTFDLMLLDIGIAETSLDGLRQRETYKRPSVARPWDKDFPTMVRAASYFPGFR